MRPWWPEDAGLGPATEPLRRGDDADVVVVGGGYTGLWTALTLRRRDPSLDVLVLEAGHCGSGPSGRNGGFVHGYWSQLATLRHLFGDAGALRLARASDGVIPAVRAITPLREGGMIKASASEQQDAAVDRALDAARALGAEEEAVPLGGDELAARCASPVFRRGVLFRDGATAQPARYAGALRDAAIAAGARVHEGTTATRVGNGHVEASPSRGQKGSDPACPRFGLRARDVVVAVNAWATGWRPVARRVTNFGSWIVLSEPVPGLLRELGWTGGEAITDGRMFLHYFRTTDDGRIAMGAGAGRIGFGGRVGREFFADPDAHARAAAAMRRFFGDVKIERSWGGPIDVSADRLPFFGTRPGTRVHYGVGYSGNGAGPSWLGGQILASLVLGEDDEFGGLPLANRRPKPLPPEPFRYLGGRLVRRAALAVDDAGDEGRKAPLVTRAVAALPEVMGLPLGTR